MSLDHLTVVLVRTRNPLNIGAAARAMSNFGVERLRVVNPYDVAFREARSAVGAAKLLANAEVFKNVADAVADCTLVLGTSSARHRELQLPLCDLEQGASIIESELQRGQVALLFGSEKVGLSNRDLSHCHRVMRIPTREQHPSMNLAQAVAVCLYELIRHRNVKEKPARAVRPAARDLDRLTEEWMAILSDSGYLKSRSANAEEKIRRLMRRLDLSAQDAELWLGMLRQIRWKINLKDKNVNREGEDYKDMQ